MEKDKQKTEVVFRKFDDGDIIAIFPKEVWNNDKNEVLSYMHIGQHGSCSLSQVKDLQVATVPEYLELKKELEIIGYNLTVKN